MVSEKSTIKIPYIERLPMKIGLSTGGGDCPGLNAAIRAVVRTLQEKSSTNEIVGIKDSINGLLSTPPQTIKLEAQDVSGILERGGTILGTSNSGSPLKNKKTENKLLENFKKLKLNGIIIIGGDGTQRIAHGIHKLGVPVIGIPKTIDNDFAPTSLSIGFLTAVDVVASCVSRLHSTAEAHSRIMVVEVMGRHAGFIALHAAIASGAHVALIPEIPFDYAKIVRKIQQRSKRGRNFTVVIVAEGAFEKNKKPLFRSSATGTLNLGGVADDVARNLHQKTNIDARVTVLGHIQRGGPPSVPDRILASLFGVKAAELCMSKQFGKVVGLIDGRIGSIDFADIPADGTCELNPKNPIISAAESLGICLGR